jgi:hypothetical protein
MGTDEKNIEQEQQENKIIIAPMEEINNIERIVSNLETVQRELRKVAKGMKAIKN